MLHYLYILYSDKYKKTYTGITRDIERRLNEHNSGKSKFTSKFLPWKLIYIEECSSREEARIKEKYYKSVSGRRRIKNIIDENKNII